MLAVPFSGTRKEEIIIIKKTSNPTVEAYRAVSC
jgi:hypothetical protein